MEHRYALKSAGRPEYGYAYVQPLPTRGINNCWHLTLLLVKRDYRGRRYGALLLKKVLDAADEEGATIILDADPLPTCPLLPSQLRKFYRKYGFRSARKNISHMIRRPAAQ